MWCTDMGLYEYLVQGLFAENRFVETAFADAVWTTACSSNTQAGERQFVEWPLRRSVPTFFEVCRIPVRRRTLLPKDFLPMSRVAKPSLPNARTSTDVWTNAALVEREFRRTVCSSTCRTVLFRREGHPSTIHTNTFQRVPQRQLVISLSLSQN